MFEFLKFVLNFDFHLIDFLLIYLLNLYFDILNNYILFDFQDHLKKDFLLFYCFNFHNFEKIIHS